ncbi:hypothetical protein C1645_832366 [Glomus cerebriforme]|uniref:Uncharacterized protein n=1 Tax=Glomus cerebriforme TaxID=658196 RepID=A0A397SHK0_9GLOM|nr:hypothetical protein C1645_832366 [Glomus cerebriforme]
MIHNPLQDNAKERPAKRLKSSGKNGLNNSISKRSINNSDNGYICCNCLKDDIIHEVVVQGRED